MKSKRCLRCAGVKRLWKCRECGRGVCEHYCGYKKPDGSASCTSCSIAMSRRWEKARVYYDKD
jgi:hypothetical protein